MKNMPSIFLTLLYCTSFLHAQINFYKTYGDTVNEISSSVRQTADGGYIVAGDQQYTTSSYKVYLVRLNATGDTLWTKTYGKGVSSRGFSVEQTSDGGFVIAGNTYSNDSLGTDVYLIKTDATGDTLWTRTYGNTEDNDGKSVKQTNDGGFVIAGTTESGNGDVYIIRTDSFGDTVWTRTYGENALTEQGMKVLQCNDTGFLILGAQFSSNNQYVYMIKTDTLGDTLWTKKYGPLKIGYSVQQTADGGYIISGQDQGDVYLLKTYADGRLDWEKTFGNEFYYETGYAVVQVSDGGYFIAVDILKDVCLVKTDVAGDTLWSQSYNCESSAGGIDMRQTSDEGFVITGTSGSLLENSDIYVLKVNKDGAVKIHKNINKVPESDFSLFSNTHVNKLMIEYNLSINTNVQLCIYDIKGRKLSQLLNQTQKAGIYKYQLNDFITGLSRGVFLIRFETGSKQFMSKFVIIR